jgi:hypothetical protein
VPPEERFGRRSGATRSAILKRPARGQTPAIEEEILKLPILLCPSLWMGVAWVGSTIPFLGPALFLLRFAAPARPLLKNTPRQVRHAAPVSLSRPLNAVTQLRRHPQHNGLAVLFSPAVAFQRRPSIARSSRLSAKMV